MDYEVELKFRRPDGDNLEARLAELGAVPAAPLVQQDVYFGHPLRDFAVTDEAFRIRSQGEHNWLTYKGPKIDAETKTRQEVEVAIEPGTDALRRITEMLVSLGFIARGTVVKHRRLCRLLWEGREVKAVLDDVERLGQFIELETISDEARWRETRDSLKRLAEALGLHDSERRSYLELLGF